MKSIHDPSARFQSAASLLVLFLSLNAEAQFTVLHSFRHCIGEANTPAGSLVASGNVLYGMGY